MEAVVLEPSGEFAVTDAPEPVPGTGQVLVDVDAIGVAHVDVLARRGEYPDFPGAGAVPGLETVGRVSAVGPDVPEDLLGAWGLALPVFGGYAERVVVDASRFFPAPQDDDVVGLGVSALVAELALRRVDLAKGESVLVRGAGGGIGILATQIAHARGAEVTAVTSSAARGERLRALGADHVVDRTGSPVPEGTYDVVIDTVAGPGMGAHLALLRPNGRYLVCGSAGGIPEPEAFAPLVRHFGDSPTLFSFNLLTVPLDEIHRSWQRIVALLGEGRLTPVIDQRLPLAEADAAVRRVEAGRPFGKVVLLPR
ncbi:MAG: zinc-binding dehydrogenase [Umezawaea sp.]